MNYIVKKILEFTKIDTIRRIIKYRKITRILNLRNGFVTFVDQVKIEDGALVATSTDPKIFIRFNRYVESLCFDCNIKTAKDSDIDIYYSEIGNKRATFTQSKSFCIGRTNGKDIVRTIIFPTKTRYIRLDLSSIGGKIDIKKFDMKETSSDLKYFEYEESFRSLSLKNKDKIVIVTHALNNTGAPLLALNIAKNFKKKKYDVIVLSLSDGDLYNKFVDNDICVISLHQDCMSKEVIDKILMDWIVKKLSDLGFDKVITNTIISGITVPYFKNFDFKIVSLIHEMKNSVVRYDMKSGGRNINMYSDYIVFPDKIVEEDFHDVFGNDNNRSIICTQGLYKDKENISLNYETFRDRFDLPINAKVIVGSGTADFRKGIDLFLQAAQILCELEDGFEYHFIWTGKIMDSELENWYENQFSKFNLKNRFHNVEFISDKKEYQNIISCCDAFWLTSREDPYPSVMIESVEYGTPVIGFKNSGGINTFLADGRGILIDNFNVEKLASETHKLLNDSSSVAKMIDLGQEFIKNNLNFNNYINKLESLFNTEFSKVEFADISVVVPNYNYEKYIELRLKSIINQTVKPREILFLDDVSKDDSVKVAEKVLSKAKKMYGIDYKIIINTENNGCFRQWNKGFEKAKYDYVWIAEADDYAQSNFIEELLPAFKKDDNIVLSYALSNVIDQYGNVADYSYTSYTDDLDSAKWNKNFIEDGKNQVINYFSRKNIVPNVSSVIFNKKKLLSFNPILLDYNIIGDWFAYIDVLSRGKISYSSKKLNGHRRHGSSIIARKEKTREFCLELLNIKQFVVENFEMSDNDYIDLLLSIQNIQFIRNELKNDMEVSEKLHNLISLVKSKMKMSSIAIIIPDLTVGGGQTVAIRIANNLTKFYNVFLFNARGELKTKIMQNMISDDVIFINDFSDKSLEDYNYLFNFKSVISFIWWSDKLSYITFKDTDVKLIMSHHGCYEMLLHNPNVDSFFNQNYNEILNRADHIVYTAEKNKEIYSVSKYDLSGKITKIDNGFILDKYPKKTKSMLGISNDTFLFGLVARGIPEKGYEEAIKALISLNKGRNKKAHLALVGSSEYLTNLETKYSNCMELHFINKFTKPSEWIGWEEIFDVGLLPSYFKSESLPTVIVEYLFLNKPVIATDIAEIKSMLVSNDDEAGILIGLKAGKADVDALTNAMSLLMDDEKLYSKMKDKTKILAQRFDMDKCIKKYINLIEEKNDE